MTFTVTPQTSSNGLAKSVSVKPSQTMKFSSPPIGCGQSFAR